jgi:hypothetical protein
VQELIKNTELETARKRQLATNKKSVASAKKLAGAAAAASRSQPSPSLAHSSAVSHPEIKMEHVEPSSPAAATARQQAAASESHMQPLSQTAASSPPTFDLERIDPNEFITEADVNEYFQVLTKKNREKIAAYQQSQKIDKFSDRMRSLNTQFNSWLKEQSSEVTAALALMSRALRLAQAPLATHAPGPAAVLRAEASHFLAAPPVFLQQASSAPSPEPQRQSSDSLSDRGFQSHQRGSAAAGSPAALLLAARSPDSSEIGGDQALSLYRAPQPAAFHSPAAQGGHTYVHNQLNQYHHPGAGQGFAGQGFAGQGFAGQGFAGQGFAGQGFAGQGFAGQGFGGQGFGGQNQAALARHSDSSWTVLDELDQRLKAQGHQITHAERTSRWAHVQWANSRTHIQVINELVDHHLSEARLFLLTGALR